MPAQAQTIDTPPFYYGEERFSIHYTSGGISHQPQSAGVLLTAMITPFPVFMLPGKQQAGSRPHPSGRLRPDGLFPSSDESPGRKQRFEAKSLRPR